MRLTINGEAKDVPDHDTMTVAELVVHLGLGEGPVAVELNREIVPRAQHVSRTIADGDVLEIVHMVGGG